MSSVAFAGVDDLSKKAGTDKVKCDSNKNECVLYQNKGKAEAVRFKSKGSVPFTVKSSNTGLVENLNADMLDGLHAADFLGQAERAADSALLEGQPADAFLRTGARAADSALLRGNAPSAFLRADEKATDSELLDGQDSSAFLGATAKASDSELLDGQDSSAFLGATAKAADAQVLDGVESDDFARVSGLVNGSNGNPLSTGITSVRNGEGDYTVTINDGTFPNSGTSCSLIRPVISPVGNEFHAAVWNEAGCLIGGGAQFDVLTFDDAGAAEDATFGFIVDVVP